MLKRRARNRKEKPVKRKRGVSEESGLNTTPDINNGFINKMVIDEVKQRLLITFPLTTGDNDPKVKIIEHFCTKYGETLSDGKWHSFQLPEDDDVYEACLNNNKLELTKTRFALALIYETDSRGKVRTKNNVNYFYAWVKVTDFVKNSIIELYEDAGDTLKGVDITVKLSAKENALKMKDYQFNISSEKGIAISNKAKLRWKDIQKEAQEIWDNLEERVVRIEEDDTILALVENYEDDDEPRRKSKKAPTTRKRKFSKKDL